MKAAVITETRRGETRVALVPKEVESLTELGIRVVVESGAGRASGVEDEAYREVGAEVAPDAGAALEGAELLLHLNPLTPDEVRALAPGTVVVSFLDPLGDTAGIRRLRDASLTGISMEMVPRITRAQSMDALSSQATVAGYKAVLLAATRLPKFLPMFTTAAGTIRPAKALILGAGVAGLQAIATARRLGAVVQAFDVRPDVREQVESLGATFLETEEEVTAEGEGGYAAELSEEQHRKELELIAEHIRTTDLVVTTARIPGRPSPELVTDTMLQSMEPGSVVVDLATEGGGNCEGSVPDDEVVRHGVTILGPQNLPATLPVHASRMYSRNIATLVKEFVDAETGALALDFDNDVVGPATVTHDGAVRNERVAALLDD